MMLRAVARVVLPLTFAAATFAAAFGLPSAAQTTSPANAGSRTQTGDQNPANAPTLGSSTSLDTQSNDVASLYGTPVEQIIARVNDQVITNSDYTRAQTELAQESRQNNWSLDQYTHSEKTLLRDLIDQQLLLSKGKQLGITGDTEMIKRLDEIRKQNHLGSLDDLEKAVEQQGTSYEDFKANIRNNIITQQVVRDEVGSKMQMSQADIAKYYNDHLDSFTQPESIHLNEILIPTSENATDAQLDAADAKAKEVEAKLKAGGKFADLAKEYSGGPTAQQGGDLGEFKRGALAKVLEDQTFNLPVGSYTEPIRTRQGYIILQVTAHNPGGTQPMQKVDPQIEQALYMSRIQPAVRQYLTRLRDEAYIDIRPGFTDAAASPNETKPTFTAYVPPQPKKKKKKKRFDKRMTAQRGRISNRGRSAAVASTAAPATSAAEAPVTTTAAVPPPAALTGATETPAATTATAAVPATETPSHSRFRRVLGKKSAKHKNKRVKLRYGHAPAASVAEQQVATTSGGSGQAAAPAAPSAATPETAPNVDVQQPLGPDLEHTPTLTQPKQQKRRFSDEARNKSARAATKGRKHQPKVKKVKHDNAVPTSLTPAEAANQKVDSAPLGLAGDTTKKKKKLKVRTANGEKTRLSDEKNSEKKNTQPGVEPASNNGGGASSGSSPDAQQPQ